MNPLKVGTHDYVDFYGTNRRIETIPIRTMLRGLCYELKLSTPLPLIPDYLYLIISSSIQTNDTLEKIHLMIAADDTWQGIVGNNWPYSKGLKISEGFFNITPKIQITAMQKS